MRQGGSCVKKRVDMGIGNNDDFAESSDQRRTSSVIADYFKRTQMGFRKFRDMKTRILDINNNQSWKVKDTKLVKLDANLLPPTVVRVCD